MNKYLVFSGGYYDSSGGWADFIDSYFSFDAACEKARSMKGSNTWVEVVDLETEEVVFEG